MKVSTNYNFTSPSIPQNNNSGSGAAASSGSGSGSSLDDIIAGREKDQIELAAKSRRANFLSGLKQVAAEIR
jgi:hypothetical protein